MLRVGIGVAGHNVKFGNLGTFSFIYFSSSGSYLLSSVEVDSLETYLGACLLYALQRPFSHGCQQTDVGVYRVLQPLHHGRSASE